MLDLVAGILGRGNWSSGPRSSSGSSSLRSRVALDGDPAAVLGFWIHVAAALLIGAALVILLDSGGVGWVLIGAARLGFISARAARSSARAGRWSAPRARRSSRRTSSTSRTSVVGPRSRSCRCRATATGSSSGRRRSIYVGLGAVVRRCSASCCASRRCTTTRARLERLLQSGHEDRRPRRAGQLPRARGDAARARRGRRRGAPAGAARGPRRARRSRAASRRRSRA